MNIIVTGTIAYDYIMSYPGRFADRIMPDKIDHLSLSFLVDDLHKQFGGTGGNIAYSLKLLGIASILASPVGNDFSLYREFLVKHKIDISEIKIYPDLTTSSYFVVTDENNNQIGSFYLGATKFMRNLSLKKIITKRKLNLKDVFVILSPTDPVAMMNFVDECSQNSYPYLFDPAFQIATFTPEQLANGIKHAKILIGNDYEIALIEKRLEMSHLDLLNIVPVVITTLGSKGSVIESNQESIHIKPAHVTKVVDPTGAGDAYRSGFFAGYARGFDLTVCGQMGSIASAYVVERHGTITHEYSQAEFCQRYQENFANKLKL
jgi:adenosine kinase